MQVHKKNNQQMYNVQAKITGWRWQQWGTLEPDRIIWHLNEVETRFL